MPLFFALALASAPPPTLATLRAQSGRATVTPAALANATWRVQTLGRTPVLRGAVPTLTFADGRVTGGTGCNSFSGIAAIDGKTIRFGAMMSTQMGCEPARMQQETRFIALLRPVMRWRIDNQGRLMIEAIGSKLMAVRAR